MISNHCWITTKYHDAHALFYSCHVSLFFYRSWYFWCEISTTVFCPNCFFSVTIFDKVSIKSYLSHTLMTFDSAATQLSQCIHATVAADSWLNVLVGLAPVQQEMWTATMALFCCADAHPNHGPVKTLRTLSI